MTPGKDNDRKGGKANGIRWNWKWARQCDLSWSYGSPKLEDKRRLPCQSCYADLPTIKGTNQYSNSHVQFGVSLWGSESTGYDYDGSVEVNGDCLLRTQRFPTRMEAQAECEKLLREFCRGTLKMLKQP